jgi:hypothetical protein
MAVKAEAVLHQLKKLGVFASLGSCVPSCDWLSTCNWRRGFGLESAHLTVLRATECDLTCS